MIFCFKRQLTKTYTFLKITEESLEDYLPANTMCIYIFKEKFSCVPVLLTHIIFLSQGYITLGIFFDALASEMKILNEFFRSKRTLWSLGTCCKLSYFIILNIWSGKLGNTMSLHISRDSRKTKLLWMLQKTLWHILSPLIRDPG